MRTDREDEPPRFRVGDRLGRFELTAKLGEGGYGQVFRATYTEREGGEDRLCEAAVKILKPDAQDEQAVERLKKEILALSRSKHPNVVRFLDFDNERGVWWFAMEYVAGGTAQDWLKHPDPPSAPRLARLIRDVLSGLEAVHEADLIHRDARGNRARVAAPS